MEKNLTEGSIGKSLIRFSLPFILGNMLQQLYNVADTLIVGKVIGATALAAVGSSYALMVLLTSIVLGLCMGSGVVFAQFYGAKKIEELKVSIFNAFIFIFLIAFVMNILSYLFLEKFLIWIRIPIEAIEFTRTYLKIIFLGMTFVAIYNFLASVLRSMGNTMIPLVFLGVSAVTNIVLDLVFIVCFKMGVGGAAYATVIAQILSAVSMFIYFYYKARHLWPQKQHRYVKKSLLVMIMNHSILSAVQQSIMNLGILMVQGLVNSFGFAVSAAFAAAVKIDAFAYMPAQDFGNAFSTFVAQNDGAGNKERIWTGFRTATKISALFCFLASIGVCVFAKPLMLLFVKAEEIKIIQIGVQYLRIEGAFYIAIGILFLLYGLYRGLGKAWMSIILTIISLASRVILAYVLSAISSINVYGIWWAVPIGWFLADIVGLYLMRISKTPKQ